MASFIFALSLFIVVLSSGCFALPFVDQELSSSTSSSLYDDSTTEQPFHLRLVSDDETTVSAENEEKRSADEHIGFQMSTSADGLLEENVSHGLRTFDEWSTSEPITFTTEQSYNDKYNQNDLAFSTVEPITQATVLQRQGFTNGLENETETENAKQKLKVKLTKSDAVGYTSTSSAVLPELYTSESSTSRSSSSSVAPQVFKSQSSTSSSTSTEKYTGLMKDENEHEHEHEHDHENEHEHEHDHDHENEHDHDHEHEYEQEQTTKYMKTQRTATYKSKVTPTKKSQVQLEDKSEEESKVQSEDKSEEDSKDSTVPTAVFDQEPLKKIPNVPNDFMILDENNDIVVPSLPTKIFTSTIKNKKEQIPLNQGSTLLLFLLAALLFCACVMASTLAFVKSRHNLKRKSRITEMEAHLDEHYHHPFMFQQHQQK